MCKLFAVLWFDLTALPWSCTIWSVLQHRHETWGRFLQNMSSQVHPHSQCFIWLILQSRNVNCTMWAHKMDCYLKSHFNYRQQVYPSQCQIDPLPLLCSPSRELWGCFVKQQQSFQSDLDDPGPGWDPDLQAGGFPKQSAHRGGPPAPGELAGGVWLQRRAKGLSSRGHCVLRLQTAAYRLSHSQLWPLLPVNIRLCCHERKPPSINYITVFLAMLAARQWWSVHHFGPDWNISTIFGWMAWNVVQTFMFSSAGMVFVELVLL